MYKIRTCVVVVCDTPECEPYGGESMACHYPSLTAAADDLRVQGWIISPAEVLCPPCVARATCDAIGHQWEPWNEYLAADGVTWRWRCCDRCNQHDPTADIDADPVDADPRPEPTS